MLVRPKLAYRHANYPLNTSLNPLETYECSPATNQPNWEEEGKIFITSPKGAPPMLLVRGEYEVISE